MAFFFADSFDLHATINDLTLGCWDNMSTDTSLFNLYAGRFAQVAKSGDTTARRT